MNLLKDIAKILKDDNEHLVTIKVDNIGVRVYLDFDPEKTFEERYIIPIHYDVLDKAAYISDSEYKEKYQDCDYGIGYNEIVLIGKIMKYLIDNGEEIEELCNSLDFELKNIKKNEDEDDDMSWLAQL